MYGQMDQQIALYPYNGVLLTNKKERTVNTYNMDKSQNNYTEYKKADKKRVHSVCFHLCKILGNTN